MLSPHGIPVDLLDRTLVIRTMPYSLEEIVNIVAIRAATEGITIDDDALAKLGDIGERTTLRYAVQLLTPSIIMAKTQGRDGISVADVGEVDALFYDAKASAKILAAQSKAFLA